MTKVQLKTQLRGQTDSRAKVIRNQGFIPAVIYGFGAANKSLKVKKHDFAKAFRVAGEFNLVDLSIDDGPVVKVIVKDVQRDGLTGQIIHVDFYQVDMNKKIFTEIPLSFVGEAKAVKDLGGTLVKNMDTVKVNCLPGDLVSQIEVDISKLDNFDQFIRLHDLVLPSGIELASATNEAVVGVVETKIEVEAPKPVEAPLGGVAGVEGGPAASEQGQEVKGEEERAQEVKVENKAAKPAATRK